MKVKYSDLEAYYSRCFTHIDCIHFNSENTKKCFDHYIVPNSSKVIPITHDGIKDNRLLRSYGDDRLRLGFIGSNSVYKGLPFLIEVLKKVGQHNLWQLEVWGSHVGKEESLPIRFRGKFAPDAMEIVYSTIDVMVVPSQCYETFSFVTLEALSFGIPVIVSDKVGAQDIVREYDPKFVYHTKADLKVLIKQIIDNRSILKDFNRKICEYPWRHDMRSHTKEIIEKIYLLS